jgi:hypothetical protein
MSPQYPLGCAQSIDSTLFFRGISFCSKWRWPTSEPGLTPTTTIKVSSRNKVIGREGTANRLSSLPGQVGSARSSRCDRHVYKITEKFAHTGGPSKVRCPIEPISSRCIAEGKKRWVWLCARSSDGFSCITASIAAIRCRVCRRSEMPGATPGLDGLRLPHSWLSRFSVSFATRAALHPCLPGLRKRVW